MSAAFAHALWNLLLARTRDPQLATAVALPVSLLVFAPIALVTGRISAAAVPFIAVSGLLELVYFALLAFAYGKAGLSMVYPYPESTLPRESGVDMTLCSPRAWETPAGFPTCPPPE
jgi:hypothetical protein